MKDLLNTPLARHIKPNSVNRRYSTANGETPVRGVRQDKPLPTTAPPSLATASPSQKMTRGGSNGQKKVSFTKTNQNYRAMPPKEKLYIWVEHDEKTQLMRIAESKGLSVSQTGRGMIIHGIRQELKIEREVLAVPILEAYFDKKLNHIMNAQAEYLGRILLETGQLRLLYVNTLFQENNRQIANEPDVEKKKTLREKFYKLLDNSLREAVKNVKAWSPSVKECIEAIKQYFKEKMKERQNT